jgi:septal ring factor EnvC (AmiA/AmiB activator)
MWPQILLALLPHLTRLLPSAGKSLANHGAGDKSANDERSADLAALAESLRGELGQVTDAHTGIYRQLREQSEQVSQVSVEVTRARMGVESIEALLAKQEARLAKLEKTAASAVKLFMFLLLVVALSASVLILLVVLLLHK